MAQTEIMRPAGDGAGMESKPRFEILDGLRGVAAASS